MKIDLKFDSQDLNTILAALHYYRQEGQGEPDMRDDTTHEIACGECDGMNENISLDDDGIADLSQRLMNQYADYLKT